MKTKTLFILAGFLIAIFLLSGCAMTYNSSSSRFTKNSYKIPKTEFSQKVHRLAFTGVEFNVDMETAGQKEKRTLAQDEIMQYLLGLGKYEVIAPAECEKVWSASMVALNIDGIFDPKTGEIDKDKYAAVCKYFLQKIVADSWLYVSFLPGTVEQEYVEGQTHTRRTVKAVDLYANISDGNSDCLWESGSKVGALAKRNNFLFIGWDSKYTPEQIMTDKNVTKAVKATFKSLK